MSYLESAILLGLVFLPKLLVIYALFHPWYISQYFTPVDLWQPKLSAIERRKFSFLGKAGNKEAKKTVKIKPTISALTPVHFSYVQRVPLFKNLISCFLEKLHSSPINFPSSPRSVLHVLPLKFEATGSHVGPGDPMLRDQMNQMDPIRSNKGVAALNLDNKDIPATATLNWKYCFVLSWILSLVDICWNARWSVWIERND